MIRETERQTDRTLRPRPARVGDERVPFIDAAGFSDAERAGGDSTFIVAELERSMIVDGTSMPITDGTRWLQSSQGRVMAIADGPCAGTALRALATHLTIVPAWLDRADERAVTAAFEDTLAHCQAEVSRELAQRPVETDRAGTSMAICVIAWPHLYVASIGDTRAMLVRGLRAIQLTRDDTLAQHLVERGLVNDPEKARQSPSVLLNALGGAGDTLDVRLVHRIAERGDHVVLMSGDLGATLDPMVIGNTVRESPLAASACRRLIESADDAGAGASLAVAVARIEGIRA